MCQGKGCSSTRKDFGLTWDVQDEIPIVLAVMVSLRVALQEIIKNAVVSVPSGIFQGSNGDHTTPRQVSFTELIQVVVHHQILPTSSIRNVQGPVERIFMLTTEFIEFITKFSERGLQKKTFIQASKEYFYSDINATLYPHLFEIFLSVMQLVFQFQLLFDEKLLFFLVLLQRLQLR